MLKTPPDILITTPESLYLLLTSQARETLHGIETVILDEVHAVAGSKRGAHLALSLERLERLLDGPLQRIGLSATQRPLEEIGRFVAGTGRDIELVDAGRRKELDLEVVVPLEDMRELDATISSNEPPVVDGSFITTGTGPTSRSIWPSIYPAILELVREHRSTIVFVNNRRLAERLALRLNELAGEELARAHHGSLAREQRIQIEELLKAGRIPCLVATSSLELGIDMGAVDLVVQVESPKSVARGLQRVGRAGHTLESVSKGRIFPKFRADLLESAVVAQRDAGRVRSRRRTSRGTRSTSSHSRSWPSARTRRSRSTTCTSSCEARTRSRTCPEPRSRTCSTCSPADIRPTSSPSSGRASSGTGSAGSSAVGPAPAGLPSPTPGRFRTEVSSACTSSTAEDAWESSTRRWSTRRARGRSSCSAPPAGGSSRSRATACSCRPAPGVPGVAPFWKGEGVGRPAELGERIGKATRELVALDDEQAEERLAVEYHLERRAARRTS